MLTKAELKAVETFDEYNRPLDVTRTLRYTLLRALRNGEVEAITVATRRKKKRGFEAKAVARARSDGKGCFIRDVDYYGMSGWVVDWTWEEAALHDANFNKRGMTKRLGKWAHQSFKPGSGFPSRWDKIVNPGELQKTKYKYGAFQLNREMSVIDYCRMLREEPKMEYLAKADLWKLVRPSIAKRLAADKGFVRFLARNAANAAERRVAASEIVYAYSRGVSLEQAQIHRHAVRSLATCKCPRALLDKRDAIVEHLSKERIDVDEWLRYVGYAERSGWNITAKGVYLPRKRTFAARLERAEREAYEAAMKKAKGRKVECDEGMVAARRRFASVAAVCGEYVLAVPENSAELAAEGEWMHNCIGSLGYDRRMADGECVIVLVKKDGMPFADVEIGLDEDGSAKIRQCYERFNSPARASVKEAAERALERVKRVIRSERRKKRAA